MAERQLEVSEMEDMRTTLRGVCAVLECEDTEGGQHHYLWDRNRLLSDAIREKCLAPLERVVG